MPHSALVHHPCCCSQLQAEHQHYHCNQMQVRSLYKNLLAKGQLLAMGCYYSLSLSGHKLCAIGSCFHLLAC